MEFIIKIKFNDDGTTSTSIDKGNELLKTPQDLARLCAGIQLMNNELIEHIKTQLSYEEHKNIKLKNETVLSQKVNDN